MPNYRGGEREMSRHGAELVKAIREGRTEKQRNRNFNQKLAFAAIQGGLTGVGAGLSAASSNALQEKQKEDALRRSSDKYKSKDYVGREGSPPDWLGIAGEGNADMLRRTPSYEPDVISAADRASGAMRSNASRESAPVGGRFSPGIRDSKYDEVDMLSRDINTAREGMRTAEPLGNRRPGVAPDTEPEPYPEYDEPTYSGMLGSRRGR